MLFIGLLIGLILGFIFGFSFAIVGQREKEVRAKRTGIIDLDGDFYRIVKNEKGEEKDE